MSDQSREEKFKKLVRLLLKAIPHSQDGREDAFRAIIVLVVDLTDPEVRP